MTNTNQSILDLLVHRVRVATVEQLTALGCSSPDAAWKRLTALEKAGLVTRRQGVAVVLELAVPIVVWRPDQDEPEWPAIAYQLSTRWNQPPRRHRFAAATEAAGERWGGYGGRMSRPGELGHDLTLTEVYLHFLRTRPREAKGWRSEARLMEELGEGRGDRLPDAMVVTRTGKTVIECAGRYDKRKLAAFHDYCRRRGLGYELW
jgi:hypothetical protein